MERLMAKSYQNEIPMARVNITLDVDTGGAQKKKELPLKLLMLGNFSQGQAVGALAERSLVSVQKNNINQIVSSFSPKLNLCVADKLNQYDGDMPVNLSFQAISDFRPECIVEQVPQLKQLMAMRNLLKDLKSCVIDNQTFRKALEAMIKKEGGTEQLLGELKALSPLSSAD